MSSFARNYSAWLICAVTIAVAERCHAASYEMTEPFVGVRHFHRVSTVPRLIDVHIVEIDPAAPGIDFLVTPSNGPAPGETVAQTTRSFLTQHNAQIAINGSFYAFVAGNNMNVQGLSASQGDIYSTFEAARLAALNISQNNIATIIQSTTGTGTAHSPTVPLFNALGGNERLIVDGVITATDSSTHPRTAAGVTVDGKLLLMTVDGRNAGHSLGITTPEMASILKQFGAHNAINLDGGGSTTLVFGDPIPRVVNVPVGTGPPGSERAVGNNLGVFASIPTEPSGSRYVFADFESAEAGYFGSQLYFSSSTQGILASSSSATSSGGGINGLGVQRLLIRDDPASSGSAENPNGWFVRHLSGEPGTSSPGSRAANEVRPTLGAIGLWAKTTSVGVEISLAIDNTANVTADRGIRRALTADGEWHRYEWNFRDSQQWEEWGDGDGIIDSPDFTLDSIQLFGPNADAVVFIDDIYHETMPIVRELIWTNDASGNWGDAANWNLGVVPGRHPGLQTAVFGPAISAPQTIYTNSARSVNGLEFNSVHAFTIAGPGSIDLEADTSGGSPLNPTVEVLAGDHQLQVKVNLSDDARVDVATGASLDFNNEVDLGGHTLTTSGTVRFRHSTIGGGSIVSQGALFAQGSFDIGGNLVSTGTLVVEVADGSASFTKVAGDAKLSGILDVVLKGAAPTGPITVLSAGGVLDAAQLSLDASDIRTFALSTNGGNLTLNFVGDSVPESNTLGLALSAFTASLLLRSSRATHRMRSGRETVGVSV